MSTSITTNELTLKETGAGSIKESRSFSQYFVIRLDSSIWQLFQLVLTQLSIFSSMVYAFNATFGTDHYETNTIKDAAPDDYLAKWHNIGFMN